jgi:hypothetical protein
VPNIRPWQSDRRLCAFGADTESVMATHEQFHQEGLSVQDRVAKPLIRTHGRVFGTHRLPRTNDRPTTRLM